MRLFRDFSNLPAAARHAVIAIGNFDGVHLGHQAVLAEAFRIAKAHAIPLAALTFAPHPREYFRPEVKPLAIYPLREKLRLLESLDVETLFLARFNAAFSALSAQAFIEEVLVRQLRAAHIVTGERFVFGQGRSGTGEVLAARARHHGFGYTAVPHVEGPDSLPVSSTRIRSLLKAGDVTSASALLGRPYAISGRVMHGDGRGRAIGVPTANIAVPGILLPALGVYAARVTFPEGACVSGVANLGVRPTFGGSVPRLEVHCFDTTRDLYGQRLSVQLAAHLRPELKFDSIESLKAQISQDMAQARATLATKSAAGA